MHLLDGNKHKVVARAHADMEGDGISGVADFEEFEMGTQTIVKVTVKLKGDPKTLAPGKHAVHIHEKADCSGGFKCAGGHFDPGPAGNTDPDVNHPFHAGDLPNIVVNDKGEGELVAVTTRVTIAPGPLSILEAEGGTSLMIHGNEDPYKGGESGSGVSGGPRIACGIIKKA